MADIIKGGYNDREAEGNSDKYKTGNKCLMTGCNNPAGTAWSPFFCVDCNIDRMDKITLQMEDIQRHMSK